MKSFEEFLGNAIEIVNGVRVILSKELSSEPEELVAELLQAEKWYAHLLFLLSQANYYLDIAEYNKLNRDKDIVVKEKEIDLAKEVATERLIRNQLESFCDCIKQRVTLGQSVLRYHRELVGIITPKEEFSKT